MSVNNISYQYLDEQMRFSELESLDEQMQDITVELNAMTITFNYDSEELDMEGVLEAIGGAIKKIVKFVLDGLEWVKKKASDLLNWIVDHVKSIVTKVKVNSLNKLSEWVSNNREAVDKIPTAVTISAYKFKNNFSAVDTVVAELLTARLDTINDDITTIGNYINEVSKNASSTKGLSKIGDNIVLGIRKDDINSRKRRNAIDIYIDDVEDRFKQLYVVSGTLANQKAESSDEIAKVIRSSDFIKKKPKTIEHVTIPVKHLMCESVISGLIVTVENMTTAYDMLKRDLKRVSTASSIEIERLKGIQSAFENSADKTAKAVNKAFAAISGILNSITTMFTGIGKVLSISKNLQSEFIRSRYSAFTLGKAEMRKIIVKSKK